MKRMLKFAWVLLLWITTVVQLMAQQRTLTGVVKDTNGEVVIGASVIVKGSSLGTITDIDGKFSLVVPPSARTLQVSYVGMIPLEVQITGSVVNVTLEEETKILDDLVVIGYGSVRKADLTGAVSSVTDKALKDIPVNSTAQALTGRLAGVSVTTTEGSPDAEILIRVRGGGSITQDNSPLYVVDGFIVNSISDIAPTDIASIDVLKDAASTAIYGAQGANGVIVITTKSGTEGKVTLNLNSYLGFKRTANIVDVLSPYEYVYYQYEIDQSTTFQNYYGRFQDIDIYKSDPGINWQNEVFNNTGIQQYYNMSLMGGTKDTKYSLSLTQTDEDFTMINSAFKRTNANFKISTKLNKSFDFVFNTRLSYSTIDGPSVSSGSGATTKLRNVVKYAPTRGLRGFDQSLDDDDNLNSPESASLLLDPVLSIQNEYRAQYKFSNLYNGVVNWNIMKGLRFSTNVNYNFLTNRDEQVWTQGTGTSRDNGGQPVAQKSYDNGKSWSISNTLNYDLKKDQGRYNFLLGQEVTNSQTDRTTALSKFFPVDKTVSEVLAAMSNGTPLPTYTNIGEPVRMSSLFGRVNVSLADKYLITLTSRFDGASVFSPQKKWGYFPGAAIAWRASEESFLLDQKDWLSNLKVRLSYGAVGNSRVGTYWRQDYGYVDLTRTKTYYPNENIENAIVASNTLRNPDLTWETTITQNLGIDFGVLNNRLSGTLEMYWNRTKDLIVAVPLPTASGYTQQFQNVGQTSNRGVELALNAYIIERKDFTLSANFNISFNKNNIDKFSNGDTNWKLYGSGWNGSAEPQYDYLVKEGGPVGQMYGYVTEGMYTFDDFNWNATTSNWDLKPGVASDASLISAGRYFGPGALKLKDIAGGANGEPDGKITEDDRTVIGNANPIHTGGFGLNTTFKGFDLAVFFNWSFGNDIYNANKIDNTSYLLTRRYQNLSTDMSLDKRFTTIDPATGYNVFYGANANPARLAELNQNKSIWHPIMTTTIFHSWAVEDGSFLRLNNLTLGYSLPSKLAKKMHMENFRVYATGYNLFVLTNYSGPDPEVSTRRSTPLTPGVDYSAYPKARSFVAGFNVTF